MYDKCEYCTRNYCVSKGTITGINTGDAPEWECLLNMDWYYADEKELEELGLDAECPKYEEAI